LLNNEVRILLHLAGKVEPGMVDYRPTPKQRSTLELLRYLTYMGPSLVNAIKAGGFDQPAWESAVAEANAMNFSQVVARLEKQGSVYADLVGGFSDQELRGEIDLFGRKLSRGVMLTHMVLGGHAAYRTQLFLYLKSCGREELNTMNLWAGMDQPAAASAQS
jgi:hypothetical protein